MRLELEFTYRTAAYGPYVVGTVQSGVRHYYEMVRGEIEGPRLNARSFGGGADWMLVDADGLMHMNVRTQMRTADETVLCIEYQGPAEPSETMRTAISKSQATAFDDQKIRSVWKIESGDPRYGWVNRSLFVGEGRFCPDPQGLPGFEHRVYRLA